MIVAFTFLISSLIFSLLFIPLINGLSIRLDRKTHFRKQMLIRESNAPANSNVDVLRTAQAMKDARDSLKNKLSPGADLSTADEQSDAAYADLINTSMDQRSCLVIPLEIKNFQSVNIKEA